MRRIAISCCLALGVGFALGGCGSSTESGTGGLGGGAGTGGEGGSGGLPTATVSMGGIAWGFTLPGQGGYDRIAGANVSVLEMPELSTTTNDQGEFTIEGLPSGSEATFVLEHESYPLAYTKTHTVPDTDLGDLTFQVPNDDLYAAIELLLGIRTDPGKCQMVSTFTRHGRTIGDPGHHGQAGAVLGIEAPDGAEIAEGPIYFGDDVIPDRSRSYGSLDGGVLILNADPGDYRLSAECVSEPDLVDDFLAEYPPQTYPDEDLRCQTEEVQFESVRMKCRPGVFVNASPSYGLQAFPPAD
jgi:hypothetical protein